MLSVGTDTAPQSFYGTIVYCPVDNALFEAGWVIRGSGL